MKNLDLATQDGAKTGQQLNQYLKNQPVMDAMLLLFNSPDYQHSDINWPSMNICLKT